MSVFPSEPPLRSPARPLRRVRQFATTLAVTLGVAFMAGTLVLTNVSARPIWTAMPLNPPSTARLSMYFGSPAAAVGEEVPGAVLDAPGRRAGTRRSRCADRARAGPGATSAFLARWSRPSWSPRRRSCVSWRTSICRWRARASGGAVNPERHPGVRRACPFSRQPPTGHRGRVPVAAATGTGEPAPSRASAVVPSASASSMRQVIVTRAGRVSR